MHLDSSKISVIVPVYKAEAYLHRCVDSLLAQTFQDYEVLLVDDGSPDRSGEICDEYARKDNRVRVFHKENGGVSSARQYGMDHAQGEYTIHADPDDWVEPTMLEELYRKAKEEDADMVICDFYVDEKERTHYEVQKPSGLQAETVCCEMFHRLHGSSCNKLVRRACFLRYEVRFPLELSYCEDLFVNACLLSHGIRVSYLPKAFYHYDQHVNPNSLVHKSYDFIFAQWKDLCKLLQNELPGDLFAKIYPWMLYSRASIMLYGDAFGEPSRLKDFKKDFQGLKRSMKELALPWKSWLLLKIALNVSPQFVRTFHKSYLRLRSLCR